MQFIFHLNSLYFSGWFSSSKFYKHWWNHCTLLSLQSTTGIATFQQKISQRFKLTFKSKFSIIDSHTVTMLLQKLATYFLLLNTFLLSCSFSSTSFLITSFHSPFSPHNFHENSYTIPLGSNCLFMKIILKNFILEGQVQKIQKDWDIAISYPECYTSCEWQTDNSSLVLSPILDNF